LIEAAKRGLDFGISCELAAPNLSKDWELPGQSGNREAALVGPPEAG